MRRREIFIELTSLLDVILIMLFVLLTQARTQTADALAAAEADRTRVEALQQELLDREAEEDALRQSAEEYRQQAESRERLLLSRDLVSENSLVITLSIPEREVIRLESEDAGTQTVSYNWENDNYARNALLSALRQQLESAEGRAVFLVFQYDRAAIYRAEYEMIRDIFSELKLSARQREIALSVLELDISE